MAHDNYGMDLSPKHEETSLSTRLGSEEKGEHKLSVPGKEGNESSKNNETNESKNEEPRLDRRHTITGAIRHLRRHSRIRISAQHHHENGPPSPSTPHPQTTGPQRRRSIAGTFVTDPTLKLPPRPKAYSFSPDGRRTEIDLKDANGIYLVEGEMKSEKDLGPYDPYNERIVDHPTTNTETLLHLLKGSLGTGILAMPNAFYHSGWALGLVGTILIGAICTYCIHLLVTCEYELCRRRRIPALNYPSTAEAALLEGPSFFNKMAPYAGHVINFFLLAYQLGICCVYVVFVASNIKDVVDIYWTKLDVRIYMVIILLPLIFINYIRNLKYLAPFSTIANIITFLGFACTLYYVFDDLPSLSDREPVGKIIHWPLFFGTVLFSLEAIGVIMPLENEMKTPKSFGGPLGVLNRAMVSIIVLYVGMGFFGYLKYGEKSAGSITLNLPPDEILAQVVKLMMAFAIFITHALQCYVAVDITWNGYLAPKFEKNNHKLFYEFVVRTLLVLFTFLLAVAIPNLELFISLIGALCLSGLGIAFPAIIQGSTYWHEKKGFEFFKMWAVNIALVLFGVLGLVVGSATSIQAIVVEFTSE